MKIDWPEIPGDDHPAVRSRGEAHGEWIGRNLMRAAPYLIGAASMLGRWRVPAATLFERNGPMAWRKITVDGVQYRWTTNCTELFVREMGRSGKMIAKAQCHVLAGSDFHGWQRDIEKHNCSVTPRMAEQAIRNALASQG